MANVTPGVSAVSGVWTTYINRGFVDGLKANLVFADYAEPASIPKGAGAYIARWNLPGMYNGTTTALTDGTSGSSRALYTISNVEATIADYGEWFGVGSLAKDSAVSGTLDVYREQCEYAGATSIDLLIRNAAITSTNFLHAGDLTTGGATLAAGDDLTAQDLPVIASFFRAQNAKGWKKLSGDYMLAINPDMELDLVTDVTTTRLSWSEVNKHVPAGFAQLIDNQRFVGRINGVTALRTTMIGTITEDVAAYQAVALARYGVGWLGLDGAAKKPMIKIKTEGGTFDPLDTLNTVGYKVRGVSALLDSNRALVVYSDIT